MRRSALYTAMTSVMAITSAPAAMAAMPAQTIMDFSGVFTMDTSPGNPPIMTPISSGLDGGILTGAGITQPISTSHPTHSGAAHPNKGNLDKEWDFFANAGQTFTSSSITVINEDVNTDGGFTKTLDFSGWRVSWNAIPSINMGGGLQDCGTTTDGICVDSGGGDIGGTYDNGSSVATIVCGTADCPFGSTFTLTYAAVVPQADPSNFGGVTYGVNISGTLLDPNATPIANDDMATTIVNNPITIDVVANDLQNPDSTTLAPSSPTSQGGTTVTTVTNSSGAGYTEVTFTPANAFSGTDTFTYTVDNNIGTSNTATVTVGVNANVAPVAADDPVSTNTALLDSAGGFIDIDVLSNDSDTNNVPGLPGGIDVSTVTIFTDATTGSCTVNPNGSIRYTQSVPAVATNSATEFCTYQVSDIDTDGTGAGPLASNIATIGIDVSAIDSDWPVSLPTPNTIPILIYEAGVPGAVTTDLPLSGSFFGMQLQANPPNNIVYTTLIPGPYGGLAIGYEQPTGISHGGAPNGFEEDGFDTAWNFFGNTGFTKTKNGGIVGNAAGDPPGTLRFGPDMPGQQGRYIITWNAIPEIDLGGDTANFPQDLGFGTINCDTVQPVDPSMTATCSDGDFFELVYAAHVPVGDPSNFGGVPYTLFLKGRVGFLDGDFQSSAGTTIASESRMDAASTGVVDPDVELQCTGSCIDYSITGVTPGGQVKLVVPLTSGVPKNPVWRILQGGTWRTFDTSQGDTVKSAPWTPGSGPCPPAGDAAYRTDATGMAVTGDLCAELTIRDFDGTNAAMALNDLDPTAGTVSDASGFGSGGTAGGGAAPPAVTTPSSTGGCSLDTGSAKPQQRSEWWLLGGFIVWLSWRRHRRQQQP